MKQGGSVMQSVLCAGAMVVFLAGLSAAQSPAELAIPEWSQRALAINAKAWRRSETPHFVIHCTRDQEKIARRCELFYDDIWKFFGQRKDLFGGKKSLVIAFGNPTGWAEFRTGAKLPANSAGVTRGNEFFYLAVDAEGKFDTKARVQAHEMTHLVVNRFFAGRLPLWVNEGLAEYFGLRKTLDREGFRWVVGHAKPMELDKLVKVTAYPEGPEAMESLYAESALLVEFLAQSGDLRTGITERERRGLMAAFVEDMMAGKELDVALRRFGFSNFDELKKAYASYRRRIVPKNNNDR